MAADWDKIEIDYRAGIKSEAQICAEHGITAAKLKSVAADRGWTRKVLSPEDEATVHAIAHYHKQEHPRFPCDSLFDEEEVKKIALMTAGQVVARHREDVAKMRGVTKHILTSIDHYIATGDEKEMVKMMGAKDGVVDLVEKTSRIMTRYVALERQAYGLENMSIDNAEGEDNPLAREVKELNQRLRNITEQKAQRAEPKTSVVDSPTETVIN